MTPPSYQAPPEPIIWHCQVASSRSVLVRSRSWFRARHAAAAFLNCDPEGCETEPLAGEPDGPVLDADGSAP